MTFVHDNNSLLSDQDTNQFWCMRELNFRFLIQLSEILLVKLTGTQSLKLNMYTHLGQKKKVKGREMIMALDKMK